VQGCQFSIFETKFKIQAFLTHLAFFENQKYQSKSDFFFLIFFSLKGSALAKHSLELHIHYKSLVTGVYDHAGCKEYCKDFTVLLKNFDIKTTVRQCICGERKCFKNWNCMLSMFLTSFNIYFSLEPICLRTAIWYILACFETRFGFCGEPDCVS